MQDRYRQLDEILLRRTAGPYIGSQAGIPALPTRVRCSPESDRAFCYFGRIRINAFLLHSATSLLSWLNALW
jgi:hypothetical protein